MKTIKLKVLLTILFSIIIFNNCATSKKELLPEDLSPTGNLELETNKETFRTGEYCEIYLKNKSENMLELTIPGNIAIAVIDEEGSQYRVMQDEEYDYHEPVNIKLKPNENRKISEFVIGNIYKIEKYSNSSEHLPKWLKEKFNKGAYVFEIQINSEILYKKIEITG